MTSVEVNVADSGKMSVITSDIVNVVITSNSNSFPIEKRFQKGITVAELKMKLELITGASATRMKLELYDKKDKFVASIDFNDAFLGSYPVEDGMRIDVIDKAISLGEFEDTSKVEKFEISLEDYERKSDSVLAFKKKNKLGRFNPEQMARIEAEKKQIAEEERDLVLKMNIGNRCEIHVPHQPTKRGTIMYIGETNFKPGYWVGIKYDEPLGKHDGSVNGKHYFKCQPKYGAFVKPHSVEVGDFPEETYDFSDDEDEI